MKDIQIGDKFTVKSFLKKKLPNVYKIVFIDQDVVFFEQSEGKISHIGIGLITKITKAK